MYLAVYFGNASPHTSGGELARLGRLGLAGSVSLGPARHYDTEYNDHDERVISTGYLSRDCLKRDTISTRTELFIGPFPLDCSLFSLASCGLFWDKNSSQIWGPN